MKRTLKLEQEKNQQCLSRRDFLQKAAAATGAYFAMPSILSQIFISRRAIADEAFGNHYFFQLHLPNGNAMGAQSLGVSATGQFGPLGLSAMGLPSDFLSRPNNLFNGFGLPFFGTGVAGQDNTVANAANFVSGMASGILQNIGGALNKTTAFEVRTVSGDDTNTNATSIMSALVKAGSRGSVMGNFSNSNSQSGINAREFLDGAKAGFARNVSDVLNSVSIAGLNHLPQNAILEMAKAVEKLGERDLQKLSSLSEDQKVRELASRTNAKLKDLAVAPAGLDARNNPIFQQAFGITAASPETDRRVVIATILSGVFMGLFNGSANTPNRDYHDTGFANIRAADLEDGQLIGSMLRAAQLSGKNLSIIVTTDGSVGGRPTTTDVTQARAFSGDRGLNSNIIVFTHWAGNKPNMLKSRLGLVNPAGGTSRATDIPSDPIRGDHSRAVAAAFANCCMLAGREADIERVIPGVFSRAELESIRIYG